MHLHMVVDLVPQLFWIQFCLESVYCFSVDATNKDALATKAGPVGKHQIISPLIQLMQGERQLQVLMQGHNSFDMSVEAMHDNMCHYLPEPRLAQRSHSSTLKPCSGEKLYNVNTAMCYKTYHCFQNICRHPFQS